MATQLTIVNSILLRLREDEVSTITETAYSRLIAKFVNDAKADMEDISYEWSPYITAVTTSILADGTRSYDLTATNNRSWLIRKKKDQTPMAFDTTTNSKAQLYDVPYKELLEARALYDNSTTSDSPEAFSIKADTVNGGWSIELVWGSNTARTWTTYWYVPQAPLSTSDNTDAATEVLLPQRPVELRALFYALEERGEVLGPRESSQQWLSSVWAIAAALENDTQVQKTSDEIDINNQERL